MKQEFGLAAFSDAYIKPPDDLAEVYVTKGKHMLEEHYHVRKSVILRWLSELEENMLKQRRRAFVRRQRESAQAQRRPTFRRMVIVNDVRPADIRLVRMAADYLRCVRNGGWRISQTEFGDWRVGIRRMSSHQLIAMAVSTGFDAEAALRSLPPSDVMGD